MTTPLLEIEPQQLKFTFELKKQSSSAIHLNNISDQCVAFKVKTTTPKKYCVRPNIGIIKPNSTCDFTVTMQAQRSAPSDIHCKDKFLIQSIIVPFGMVEDEITSGMFIKDTDNKHIQETKLRVTLVTPPSSPVLLPLNGDPKQQESPLPKDKLKSGLENLPPLEMIARDEDDYKNAKEVELPRPSKDVELRAANDMEVSPVKFVESIAIEDEEGQKPKLNKDIEELKSKLDFLNSMLFKAEFTLTKLMEEKSTMIQENETLNQELAVLRRREGGVRKVQVGFPSLFVCMIGLIGVAVGYLLHS